MPGASGWELQLWSDERPAGGDGAHRGALLAAVAKQVGPAPSVQPARG